MGAGVGVGAGLGLGVVHLYLVTGAGRGAAAGHAKKKASNRRNSPESDGGIEKQDAGAESDQKAELPYFGPMWFAIVAVLCFCTILLLQMNPTLKFSVARSIRQQLNIETALKVDSIDAFWAWYIPVLRARLPTDTGMSNIQERTYNSTRNSPQANFFMHDVYYNDPVRAPPVRPMFGFVGRSRLVLPISLVQKRQGIKRRDDGSHLYDFLPVEVDPANRKKSKEPSVLDPRVRLVLHKSTPLTKAQVLALDCVATANVTVPVGNTITNTTDPIIRIKSLWTVGASTLGVDVLHGGVTAKVQGLDNDTYNPDVPPLWNAAELAATCEQACRRTVRYNCVKLQKV